MTKVYLRIVVGSLTLSLAIICTAVGCSKATPDVSGTNPDDSGTNPGGGDDNPGLSDTDTGAGENPFEDCTSLEEGADNSYQPADIVFVIDNSPSLEDEIAQIRANMNSFSEQIMNSGLDPHIVIISCLPGDCGSSGGQNTNFFGICIDPPLAAADGCQGDSDDGSVSDDTKLPQYKHLSTRVPSMKGLRWIVETFEDSNDHTDQGWSDILRAQAVKHFVVVSDDADEWSAAEFDEALRALNPAMLSDYKFHGIFSYLSKDEACAIDSSEPCCQFSAPEDDPSLDWQAYSDLVSMTGGVSGDLCLQDFDPVFEALGTSIVSSSEINCQWEIPAPPAGESLDTTKVNVEFKYDAGQSYFVGHVNSVDDCVNVSHGWYFDDPINPSLIKVCPQTCDWFKNEQDAQLVIHFGCETEEATPV